MQKHSGCFKPPAEHGEQIDPGREQWDSHKQHADVAEKDDDNGKKITLFRDVGLACFQNVPGQGHVKCVRRSHQQMEPDRELFPVPDQMSGHENQDDDGDIDREKIGRERDQEIRLRDDHVPASGSRFEFFNFATKKPRPEHVREFVTEDVNPHRFRQEQKNADPARRAREHGDPRLVGAAGGAKHLPQSVKRADADGQQNNGDDEFGPFGHGDRI